jgi:hypothetical protein
MRTGRVKKPNLPQSQMFSSYALAGGMVLALALGMSGCSNSDKTRKPQTAEAGFVVVKAETVEVPVTLPGRTAAF